MKTRAAVLYKSNKPLVIEDGLEVPALGRGQVLVKIYFSGVCHSQLMEARGKRGEDKYLPHLMGHEATAEVLDIGQDVSKVKKGDRLVLTWIKAEGIEAGGTRYKKGEQFINAGPVAVFSEFAVVSENRCVKLPDGVPLDVGSLLGCAIQTGAGIITNTIQPGKGSTLAIFGAGGVGLSALIAAKLYNCSAIIAVDVEDHKLQLAKEFGATYTINSALTDPVEKIRALTGGQGVDYAVDASGKIAPIEQAFASIRKGGGLCVFATHPAQGEKIKIDPFDLICGKQIKGSWGGGSKPDVDIPRFAQLYLAGKLPLEKLISKRYPLEKINQTLEDIENRQIARGLLAIG